MGALLECDTQLAQGKENLARVSDKVEVRVRTRCNRVKRTRRMVALLLATRAESRTFPRDGYNKALNCARVVPVFATDLAVQTLLLQSQLETAQVRDELRVRSQERQSDCSTLSAPLEGRAA